MSEPASSWDPAALRRRICLVLGHFAGEIGEACRSLYGAAHDVEHQLRTLATPFHIKGVNYSITSACATSTHCIGNAAELIQFGKQDIVFAGGGEELDWTMTLLFDAMPALSSKSVIHRPRRAGRTIRTETDL